MQSITVAEKGANTKIEQYIQAAYPSLSFGALQKAFRRRDIKVNGVRVGRDYIVASGDRLEIYIKDELLFGTGNTGKTAAEGKFTVAYEDDNLIIVNKAQGVPVHPDREQSHETLIDLVRVYLRERDVLQTNELQTDNKQTGGHQAMSASPDRASPDRALPDNRTLNDKGFQPELCHRLDRNTGGLVIIAKNKAARDFIIKKLESREIKKYYQCLVAGKMEKKEARLHAYLWKDAAKSRVFISDRKKTGAQEIITVYRVLEYDKDKDISRLEIELVTGRTHQIRAHMAYIGHPVIGDGKYGRNTINRVFGLKQQALWAYRLKFDFTQCVAHMKYLDGKEISVEPGFMPVLVKLSRQNCPGKTIPAELSRQNCPGKIVPAELSRQNCPGRTIPAELSRQYPAIPGNTYPGKTVPAIPIPGRTVPVKLKIPTNRVGGR